jgi:hypothetical protein
LSLTANYTPHPFVRHALVLLSRSFYSSRTTATCVYIPILPEEINAVDHAHIPRGLDHTPDLLWHSFFFSVFSFKILALFQMHPQKQLNITL